MIRDDKKEGKSSRAKWVMTVMGILMAVTCSTLGTVQAKEETFASRGNLIYVDGSRSREGLAWYMEDLLLLKEKLSTIPSQCFDPACYTHEHCWVYQDMNENTHTKHCDGCGAAFDSTGAHVAVREERCVISHGGREYPGRKFICDCGWQWMRETGHTLLYNPLDAVNHTIRCALDGSAYCQGYEPVTEEHYAYYYVPDDDGVRHWKVCIDCGYREEEACGFSFEKPPLQEDAEDENTDETQTEQDADCRWCVCGNCKNIKQEDGETDIEEEPVVPAEEESPELPVTPEPPADEEEAQPEIPKVPEDEEAAPPEEPKAPEDEEAAPPEEPKDPADEEIALPEPPELPNISEDTASEEKTEN